MIGFLYPEICNQQGDQGYRDWLESNGFTTSSVTNKKVAGLKGLVVGDVSEQGGIALESLLAEHWFKSELENGLSVLAIGRAGQILSKIVGVEPFMDSHKSQFAQTEFNGEQLFGYVNGPHNLENLVVETLVGEGRLISCALLGPVAVVNPWFEKYCFGVETASRDDLIDHYRKLASD